MSAAPAPLDRSQHRLTSLLYLLNLIGVMTAGATTIVAVIVNYVKRASMGSDLYRPHFDWQLRSAFWFLGLLGISAGLIALAETAGPPAAGIAGALLWLFGSLWFIYRVLKGYMWLTWNERVGPWRSKQ